MFIIGKSCGIIGLQIRFSLVQQLVFFPNVPPQFLLQEGRQVQATLEVTFQKKNDRKVPAF